MEQGVVLGYLICNMFVCCVFCLLCLLLFVVSAFCLLCFCFHFGIWLYFCLSIVVVFHSYQIKHHFSIICVFLGPWWAGDDVFSNVWEGIVMDLVWFESFSLSSIACLGP